MGSEKKKSSSKGRSVSGRRVSSPKTAKAPQIATAERPSSHFAICLRNDGYPASLELRKLYPVLEDPFADEHDLIRVVDESGEDYLFPNAYFARVELPQTIERALRKIA